ncbi:hypothetical protein ACFQV8_05450 [Pseudonocardia benzenivorans]
MIAGTAGAGRLRALRWAGLAVEIAGYLVWLAVDCLALVGIGVPAASRRRSRARASRWSSCCAGVRASTSDTSRPSRSRCPRSRRWRAGSCTCRRCRSPSNSRWPS